MIDVKRCCRCDRPATWRVCLCGYYSTSKDVCDAHVFDALDGKLTGSWEDYACEVRRLNQ